MKNPALETKRALLRLRLMRLGGSLLLGLSLWACRAPADRTEDPRPNVILITADDLGWKDLACYGNEDIQTPHIDALAHEGVRFENAFVVAPSCSPSRASLITGQYPHTNGVTALTHRYPKTSLSPRAVTLAGELKEAGYKTAIDGKWHPAVFFPVSWFGYEKRMTGFGLKNEGWMILDARDALGFIEDNQEKPFYLEMNFIQNHRIKKGQFFYSEEFPVDPEAISVPEHYALPDWPEIREDLAKYYSQTMEMDAIIGDLVSGLEELGIRDNTIILFVSDNGQPYPGAKMTHYDRGIGVPLIMNWPDQITDPKVLDDLISSIDIMPSLLEACGIERDTGIQGQSFWPLVQGADDALRRDAVFSEMTHHVKYLPGRAVRTREWKYIRNYSDIALGLDELRWADWPYRLVELDDQPWIRPRVEEELYSLVDDPREQLNLAANPDYADILNHMRTLLRDHQIQSDDSYLDAPFTHDYKAEDYLKPEE